jgi:hypothetical protein
VTDAETKAASASEQMARLRKSGREEDAQAIILQMLG